MTITQSIAMLTALSDKNIIVQSTLHIEGPKCSMNIKQKIHYQIKQVRKYETLYLYNGNNGLVNWKLLIQ